MPIQVSNINVVDDSRNINAGVVTASGFVGTLEGNITGDVVGTASTADSLSENATGVNLTLSGDLTVNGTQTIINTTSLEIADKTVGIASTSTPSDITADGAGIVIYGDTNKSILWENDSDSFTFSDAIDIKGAVETVSIASTYDLGDGKVILECDAQQGTVFSHNMENGVVGIVSLRNFPVTKNSVSTYTIIFDQLSSIPVGGGNTTAATGIGTNVTLAPLSVSGFTTSARVATATTVVLSPIASDIDIITLSIHYNGAGTGTPTNYKLFATGNNAFRFGSIGY